MAEGSNDQSGSTGSTQGLFADHSHARSHKCLVTHLKKRAGILYLELKFHTQRKNEHLNGSPMNYCGVKLFTTAIYSLELQQLAATKGLLYGQTN